MKKILWILLILFSSLGMAAPSQVRIFLNGHGSDICTGFAVPGTLQAEETITEVEFICLQTSLQVRFRCFHPTDRPYKMPPPSQALFLSDHVEFFIQPNPSPTDYYHFAVGIQGGHYTAKNRNATWKNNTTWKIRKEKLFWETTFNIPLQEIHLDPQNGRTFRFNACRARCSDKELINSTFALLPGSTFHDPENWKTAVFCPAAKPVRIVSREFRPNLIRNPEFKFTAGDKIPGWTLGQDSKRIETAALSDDWIIHGSGDAYVMMHQTMTLGKNQDYTLQVKARRFGKDGRMGIIMMTKAPDGQLKEVSPYLAWNHPLTDSFREYRFSFKAPADLVQINLYRLADHPDSSNGVEYSFVRLYAGRQSPIEIRPYNFFKVGLKKRVPGTGPDFPANLYGRSPRKPRLLNIFSNFGYAVQLLEQLHGLNMEYDLLAIYGEVHWTWTPDIYYTDNDPETILKKITQNQYDIYYLADDYRCAEKTGRRLYAMLYENIQKGAALWVDSAVPLPIPGCEKKISHDTLLSVGKGRILRTVPIRAPDFNWLEPADARAERLAANARRLYRLAGNSEIFSNAVFSGDRLSFDAPPQTEFRWELYNPVGTLTSQGQGKTVSGHAEIQCRPEMFSGIHKIRLYALDSRQETLDYVLLKQTMDAPAIQSIATDKAAYSGYDTAMITVLTTGSVKDDTQLHWHLKDWTGRILDKGQMTAADSCLFKVSVAPLYTNLGKLQVSLFKKNKECARQEKTILVRDRDRQRHAREFTVSNWNSSGDPRFYSKQLEEIGIDNCLRPYGMPLAQLIYGQSVAGDPRGDYSVFYPTNPPINKIRQPSLSDPRIWEPVLKKIERLNKKEWPYGLTSAGIGDEIGLMDRNWKLDDGEVDAHPLTIGKYQQAMQKKYKTIEAFNRICGTRYADFTQLAPIVTTEARQKNNFAEFLEWRNFNTDLWVDSIARIGALLKESDPEYPYCLYNSFGPRPPLGNDYWKLLTQGHIDFSFEYTSQVYPGRRDPLYDFDEIYRSLRPGMPVWGFFSYSWSKFLADFQPWWFALHRYQGMTWFSLLATQGGGTLVTMPEFELTQEADLLRKAIAESRLLDGIGRLCAEYSWAPRDIAVLWSQPSMLVSWCLGNERSYDELRPGSSYHDWHFSRYAIRYMLEDLLYQYDYVVPEQLGATLQNRKVLILPHAIALSDKNMTEIKSFIHRGGTVIADIPPGDYTELGIRRTVNPLTSSVSDSNRFLIIGQCFNDQISTQRVRLFTLLQKTSAEPILRSPSVPRLSGREAMHFVAGKMHVYGIVRDPNRSEDHEKQAFIFPAGHVYDIRNRQYLGKKDHLELAIPSGNAAFFGVYPYQILSLDIQSPETIRNGQDFTAGITIHTSTGEKGHHIFHARLIRPDGTSRRRVFARNLSAPQGQAELKIRMAHNDPTGKWKLQVTDVLSGITQDENFILR